MRVPRQRLEAGVRCRINSGSRDSVPQRGAGTTPTWLAPISSECRSALYGLSGSEPPSRRKSSVKREKRPSKGVFASGARSSVCDSVPYSRNQCGPHAPPAVRVDSARSETNVWPRPIGQGRRWTRALFKPCIRGSASAGNVCRGAAYACGYLYCSTLKCPNVSRSPILCGLSARCSVGHNPRTACPCLCCAHCSESLWMCCWLSRSPDRLMVVLVP